MEKSQARRSPTGRAVTVLVCVFAGLLITVSAVAARGTDLRNDRSLTLRELITEQGSRNTEMQQQIDEVRGEVASLTDQDLDTSGLQGALADASLEASAAPVEGPGVRVTLDDAPSEVNPDDVDENALIVHQQDIQAVVNALWAGGAEAMTIQGQRVISTTGVKCVGNTVVLHGVPYAPPYRIEAIGDQELLEQSLADSEALQVYRQYVDAYGLGYSHERVATVEMPGYVGSLGITHASAGDD